MKFEKGLIPHNKGRKASEFMTPEGLAKAAKTRFKKGAIPAASVKTRFKKGLVPHNTKPEMSLSDRKQSGRIDRCIKIGGKWHLYSRYVWEQATGEKLGRQDMILFADGNRFNFDVGNLKKINRRELFTTNTSQVPWTEEDLELLKRIYPTAQKDELERIFNRNRNSISNKACMLGLVKSENYLSENSVVFSLYQGKDEIRDAILADKSLIDFKRSQILLKRKLKKLSANEEVDAC
jgi:hypothetical protein